MKDFDKIKTKALTKDDQSNAGSWDPLIKPVCDLINSLKNYCTTSSCSGRIIIVEKTSKKKCDTEWRFVKHDTVTFQEIKESLNTLGNGTIWFNLHPFMLHISCRTIEDAFKLLKILRNNGFKRVGINGPNKNVIELIGTEKIETPIAKDSEIYIQEEHLEFLVNETNKKFNHNKEQIDKLFNAILKFSEE